MSGPIEVNYAKLDQCADAVNKAQRTMETKLEQVEADVAKLGQSWTGEAQTAYKMKQDKLNEAQAELAQTLAKIEIAIKDTNERYRTGEGDITKMF